MIDFLLTLDRDVFMFLNKHHTDWLDPIMFWISKTIFWLPLYTGLLVVIIKYFKKDSWIILATIGVAIILSDQMTSTFMKPFFQRLRPSRDPALEGLVHIVNGYKGGKFGFASSHASNTFAVAVFIWLLLKPYFRYIWILFTWAIVVTYSRIYLGVHYPGDIIVGMLIGLLMGWIAFRSQKLIIEMRKRKLIKENGK